MFWSLFGGQYRRILIEIFFIAFICIPIIFEGHENSENKKRFNENILNTDATRPMDPSLHETTSLTWGVSLVADQSTSLSLH